MGAIRVAKAWRSTGLGIRGSRSPGNERMRRRTTKKTDRQQRILQELRANTAIRISELAKELGVSGETIRRDLAELGEAGAVNRTYGGAVARPFGAEPNWSERHNLMREERQQMAKVAVGLASPGDVLMLE